MLGLMHDKGHGVPQDFVLAYKWLNLAASRAARHERDYFLRLRNIFSTRLRTGAVQSVTRASSARNIRRVRSPPVGETFASFDEPAPTIRRGR
jgi:hypothetical protein